MTDETDNIEWTPPPGRRRRKPKKAGSRVLIRAIVILVVTVSLVYVALYRFMPSFEIGSVYDYEPNMSKDGVNLMFSGELLALPNPPVLKDGQIYLPADFLKEHFDPYIFWEPEADRLTFTSARTVVVMKPGDADCLVNRNPARIEPPALRVGSTAYIPESLIPALAGFDPSFSAAYHYDMRYEEEYRIVIIDRKDEERTVARLTRDTNMRFEADIKSPVAQKLTLGEELVVLEAGEDFVKARLSSGLTGYVAAKAVGKPTVKPPVAADEPEEAPPIRLTEGKAALLWDQVFDAGASASLERQEAVPGIDVISPTWFSFDAEQLETGNEEATTSSGISSLDIKSLGNAAYVEAAHVGGYKVWPLISDNFNSGVSHAVLTDPVNRDYVIKQLLALLGEYGADGINIDFEAVLEADAPYYLQFLRELNPLLKEEGLALSVDMFVPTYTKYYNRTEVGKVVDYVCVMTYDEHYSGSPNTGPVASLGFVEDGIAATLAEVPKEKVLMGLPFYVRVWTENVDENGNVTFYKQDTTMQNGFNQFARNDVEFIWNQDLGCYYGEYETIEDGAPVTKKVWLEDERSIAEKLKLAQKYDLAGVACWKRYLEKRGVWTEIENYKLAYKQVQ